MRFLVVYFDPSDYPKKYVVRGWTLDRDSMVADDAPLAIAGSIEVARLVIPNGYINIRRMEHDDPAIYEVWV